jgi:cellulose synthase/poly-beta-1,6-N-acetylglucosamine synthase-like glycosyltransferase
MNRTFSDGYKIITSYRNSKNYGANWISAGYAHWFLREAKYLNHPRMALGTSCAVSGTGFVFSADILKKCGGWNFFLLTEDIEFTVHSIVCGEVIGYCPDAVLYDEQPTRFAQSWRQRKRWARGYLQVYGKYSRKLLCGIFRGSYSCFDALMSIMPALLLSVFGLSFNLAMGVLGLITNQDVMPAVISSLKSFGSSYLLMFGIGILTTVTEWKQIHTTTPKKLFYTLTFPVFMFTYIPIALSALFGKVEWKPIEHRVSVSLEELLR